MASAPQHDPNQLGSRPVNSSTTPPPGSQGPVLHAERQVEREVGTGRAFGFWWVWILAAIAIVWFCGWGWGSYGGWWFGHATSQTGSAQSASPTATPGNGAATASAPANAAPGAPTGTGLAILESANKASFIGQPFNVNNVPVLKKAGNNAWWIGTPSAANAGAASFASSILIIMPRNSTVGLRAGEHVDVAGTVEKAPSSAQARREWNMNGSNASELEQNQAYVQATQVVGVQQ